MRKLVGRRQFLSVLPVAAVPGALAGTARATVSPDSALLLNAADSLGHYSNLVDKVSADAYRSTAINLGHAVDDCNAQLGSLRDDLTKLQARLKVKNGPALQARFNVIDQSLTAMIGTRPGEQRAAALNQLPSTLDTLKSLMSDVTRTCDLDSDGETGKLIEQVYQGLNESNGAVAQVAKDTFDWSGVVGQVDRWTAACRAAMDRAAVAIVDGATGSAGWKPKAEKALNEGLTALKHIDELNVAEADAAAKDQRVKQDANAGLTDRGQSALETLEGLLIATVKSLDPPGKPRQVAFWADGRGEEWQQAVPSTQAGGNQLGLWGAVKALVQPGPPHQQQYFTPGRTTQIVNCIAVCFPVWLTYGTNSQDDIDARKGLIDSALYFNVIEGTVKATRAELRDKLQGLYLGIKNA